MKVCTRCVLKKQFSSFSKQAKTKDGLKYECKSCSQIRKKTLRYQSYLKSNECILLRRKYSLKYRKTENFKISKRKRENKAYATSLQFRLTLFIRTRLRCALVSPRKDTAIVKDLGCTLGELRLHIEKQFKPGMTWENHGVHGWHTDHKIPLASFDLSDREQFLEACHFSNLQPLWAEENVKKKDSI